MTFHDPVRRFEHAHGHLTKMALDVRQLVLAEPTRGKPASRLRRQLAVRLEELRDALLHHFADEEEALFPFLREHVPGQRSVIEALEGAHDVICGSLLRLSHLVERGTTAMEARRPELLALYERFERAYTEHSQSEVALFEALDRTLDAAQRAELAAILRGL